MTGILGNSWSLKEFSPMGDIPHTVRLTMFASDVFRLSQEELQSIIDKVETGKIKLNIDTVFSLHEVPKAHEYMESNQAKGKLVVTLT